jgi:hypothetical protein
VTTKAPVATSKPATTTKKLSARDLDTHGDPNIDVNAVLTRAEGNIADAQWYIDKVIEKYGKDAILRHVRGDGHKDPAYDLSGVYVSDPDSGGRAPSSATIVRG